MGELLPPEEYSLIDCDNCEANPPGAPLWENGETPEYIYAYFEGIKICNPGDPVAPSRVIMKHDPLNACMWTGTRSDGWTATLDFRGGAHSGITLSCPAGNAFVGSVLSACAINFTNFLICIFPADIGWGGTCRCRWFTDRIPMTLADTYGLMPVENSLYDRLSELADIRTYRMTHPSGQTNIQIKVDTDDIPP